MSCAMPISSDTFAPSMVAAGGRTNLIGMGRAEMAAVFAELGQPRFRADQVFRWIYARGVGDFDAMTNVSKALRVRLAERFVIARPAVSRMPRPGPESTGTGPPGPGRESAGRTRARAPGPTPTLLPNAPTERAGEPDSPGSAPK